MSCGVGPRLGSDLVLLWLWCRPAVVAPIRPLAWEPPDAAGMALKGQKPKKKKRKKERKEILPCSPVVNRKEIKGFFCRLLLASFCCKGATGSPAALENQATTLLHPSQGLVGVSSPGAQMRRKGQQACREQCSNQTTLPRPKVRTIML